MNFEDYKNNKENLLANIKTVDELVEKVKTPQELLDYMSRYIKYSYASEEKVCPFYDKNFDKDFDKEYLLQSPEQLLNSQHGVCWDQAELERDWFLKKGYKPKLFFVMFAIEKENNLPTHTFLVYQEEDKYYWFENSWGSQRGIHKYDNLELLIEDVKEKHFLDSKKAGELESEDRDKIKFYEYEKPEKFSYNPAQFIESIVSLNYSKLIK